jgi:hypothetical protein
MDAHLGLRCPACRSIDWFRDCNVVVQVESTGDIVYRCVLPSQPTLTDAPWSCMSCAYEVPEPGLLAAQLNELEAARPH